MYVGVIHRITDTAVWEQKIQAFEEAELPAGLENPISYIGADRDYAFCLWDVPSVAALQPTLDSLTEGAADNTYFPVDPNALGTGGIPEQRVDLTDKDTAKSR
jgi:hypothetical protein